MMAAMPRHRQIIFAIVILFAVLVAAEAGLRIFDIASSPAFLLLVHSHARDVPLLEAPEPGFLFVHPIAQPAFGRKRYSRNKMPGTTRMLCLGGSTVRGGNLAPYDTFPGQLEDLLSRRKVEPAVSVENLGGNGMTSRQLRWVAAAVTELRPDVTIIYTGHNDWTGARLYGDLADNPAHTKWRARLAASRLFLAGRQVILAAQGESDTALRTPTGGPATTGELERVAEHLTENLRAITATLHAAGGRVVLCTVVSNVLFPPAGCPLPNEYYEHYRDRPMGTVEDDLPLLIARLETAPPDGGSLRSYLQGLRALRAGDRIAAWDALTAARDADSIPLRAGNPMHDAVRRAAAEADGLIDLDRAFADAWRAGAPAEPWFSDNLHPTAAGAGWIAAEIAAGLIEQGVLTAGDAP